MNARFFATVSLLSLTLFSMTCPIDASQAAAPAARLVEDKPSTLDEEGEANQARNTPKDDSTPAKPSCETCDQSGDDE